MSSSASAVQQGDGLRKQRGRFRGRRRDGRRGGGDHKKLFSFVKRRSHLRRPSACCRRRSRRLPATAISID